jgi:outer membrane lipoprotein-sorting protein
MKGGWICRFAVLTSGLLMVILPLDPPRAGSGKTRFQQNVLSGSHMTGETVLSKLVQHDEARALSLQQYSVDRTYLVKTDSGKLRSEAHVSLSYKAPDTKAFQVLSENGPAIIRNLVNSLLQLEVEAALAGSTHDNSITPANYIFTLAGEEEIDGSPCFVVQAVPKRREICLFEGKVWIDEKEFAIVKIAGEPAKSPSFWIKRASFVRQYQRIGGNWLPLKDETVAQVRIFGENTLTIYHNNYQIQSRQDVVPGRSTPSPDPTRPLSFKDLALQ